MSTVLIRFDTANLTPANVNANFAALAAAVNALNGELVVTIGAIDPGASVEFVPKTGGSYLGAITAPSLLVGPSGAQHPVVTQADAATAIADLNQTIGGAYSQPHVQALSDKLDELLGVLRTAGFLKP